MAIFGPDQEIAQNLPKIAGLRKQKNLHGRTGAHFWTSGSKLDKTVPAIIAQFGDDFESFKVVGFHENDSTLGSGGLRFLNLIGISSNIYDNPD